MAKQGGLSRIIAVGVDTDGDPRDLLLNTAGRLQVDVVTQPAGGANVIAAQGARDASVQNWYAELRTSGGISYDARDRNWTISETVPISAVSLPLPTGAAQEHVGAASFHAARLTDGVAFYKPTTPADTQPISAASLPTHGVTKSGSWPLDTAAKGTTAAGSPTSGALDANTQPLHVSLKETITVPVSGTFWQATQPVSIAAVVHVDDNAGSLTVDAPVGTPVAVRLSDGAAFYDGTKAGQLPAALVGGRLDINIGGQGVSPLVTADNQTIADNAAFTDGTSKLFVAGYIFDEVAGTALTENDAAAARINANRATVSVLEDDATRGRRATIKAASTAVAATDTALVVGVSPNTSVKANIEPETAGGLSISRLISAATTNATSAKASAGQVYGWYLYNANAAVRYFKLYNKASAPTVGTDTPVMTIPIPPGAAANVEFTNGVAFGTGIGYATTTGVADSDAGAVAANEIVINLLYK